MLGAGGWRLSGQEGLRVEDWKVRRCTGHESWQVGCRVRVRGLEGWRLVEGWRGGGWRRVGGRQSSGLPDVFKPAGSPAAHRVYIRVFKAAVASSGNSVISCMNQHEIVPNLERTKSSKQFDRVRVRLRVQAVQGGPARSRGREVVHSPERLSHAAPHPEHFIPCPQTRKGVQSLDPAACLPPLHSPSPQLKAGSVRLTVFRGVSWFTAFTSQSAYQSEFAFFVGRLRDTLLGNSAGNQESAHSQ